MHRQRRRSRSNRNTILLERKWSKYINSATLYQIWIRGTNIYVDLLPTMMSDRNNHSELRKKLQLILKRPKLSSALNSSSSSDNQKRRNRYHLPAQPLQLLCLAVLLRLVEEEEEEGQLLFLPREDLLGKSGVYTTPLQPSARRQIYSGY